MEIFKEDIMLFYEFRDWMYRESDNDAFNRFKKLIDEYVNVITFYNKGLENLSNLEMYDLLYKLYDILFDDNDCLKVLSQKYNKKYNRFVEFGTYMTFSAIKHWKEGKSTEYENVLYQIRYIAAVSSDVELEDGDILRKSDIKKMIDEKNIILIKEREKQLEKDLNVNEKYEKITLHDSGDLSYEYEDVKNNNDLLNIIISMLMKKITIKKLERNIEKYIQILNEEIEEVLSDLSNTPIFKDLYSFCNEWYEFSGKKEQIKKLCKR